MSIGKFIGVAAAVAALGIASAGAGEGSNKDLSLRVAGYVRVYVELCPGWPLPEHYKEIRDYSEANWPEEVALARDKAWRESLRPHLPAGYEGFSDAAKQNFWLEYGPPSARRRT
jgi:hypothetical protein